MKQKIEKRVDLIFIRLKSKHKLNYVTDYNSFTKNKMITKYFIKELEDEINKNNHSVVYMMLSLGIRIGKINRGLDTYWDYCYNNRFEYDGFRNLLIEFPKMFNNKKKEIYKELGDIEFDKAKGHFMDVDFHLRVALKYYKAGNLQEDIERCMIELQENKPNTEENFPKPTEMRIPISEADLNQKESHELGSNYITRVTRSGSNNLIYSDLNIHNMIEINFIKNNIVVRLYEFFRTNENISFDNFLDFYSLKKSWFFESNIYQMMLPALFHFYDNFKIDIEKYKNKKPISRYNYVLPLDSLILKFEGIVRLYLVENGNLIIKEGKKNKIEENVDVFKLLEKFNELLINEEKEKFDREDKPFFEHIFGSNEMNLRNEIAHSIIKPESYSPTNVIYIIDSIARIGKYPNPKSISWSMNCMG